MGQECSIGFYVAALTDLVSNIAVFERYSDRGKDDW